ncbi:MAG: hypothetical protein HYW02_08040 [Deltaproteobacteria bacterium]|nr:hypothetical protein [Deltaproteobacteria bacterium]MBI2501386.1 hypothetical protein [Deltaproteobacteria bacterium]MBI4196703.1 hypothetical protein [Deltaproteobacteria bacterium]
MKFFSSLLLGGILSGINLYLLSQIIKYLSGSLQKKKLVLLIVAKFLVFFGIIALILWRGHVTPLAFLGGFTIPLIGYLGMSLTHK